MRDNDAIGQSTSKQNIQIYLPSRPLTIDAFMTDLSTVLPDFPTQPYIRLIPSLERNHVTTADLLTLDCLEIAKRAQLPLLDLKRLCKAVLQALQSDLGVSTAKDEISSTAKFRKGGKELMNSWATISTLDDGLDQALGGGIPAGYITEITGESGAGKTQFLLTLLLAVQLPAPYGLSANALYISTESALPTTRVTQLLASLSFSPKPSLDKIISIVTPDLESQDHILRFQVPVAIKRHGIKLLILDSVAANYRAEFERPGGGRQNMAQRSTELVKLGQFLRDLARDHNLAVVVSNQVADRFGASGANSPVLQRGGGTQSSPLARRSGARAGYQVSSIPIPSGNTDGPSSTPFINTLDPMSLDHQQRFFTGWGDSPLPMHSSNLKTPSLGLIWSTQIACRIALIKKPVYEPGLAADAENERGELVLKTWKRWMKVVFAPHVRGSGTGVEGSAEFEIRGEGIKSVQKEHRENQEEEDL